MKIPDLTSPKVMYPALVFAALRFYLNYDSVTFSLIFGICYCLLLKILGFTCKREDIISMTILAYAVDQTPAKLSVKMLVFLIIAGFLRSLFPKLY